MIVAKVEITEPASGEHPALLMARKGDELEIVGDGGSHDFTVINRSLSPSEFGINLNEIESAQGDDNAN